MRRPTRNRQRRDIGLVFVSVLLGVCGVFVILTGGAPYSPIVPGPHNVSDLRIHGPVSLAFGLLLIAGAVYFWIESGK